MVEPTPGLRVWPEGHRVEIEAVSCLTAGWLEQIACAPQTREHESLVVVPEIAPSQIHFGLLLAGFEAGRPGQWTLEGDQVALIPPEGSPLRVTVRYTTPAGEARIESIREWIVDGEGELTFPEDRPWVFGGSMFRENPEWMGPGEHYVADMTGSIIGLVTFGDETIGFAEVVPDQVEVHPAEWQVAEENVPPLGTPVTLILTPFDAPPPNAEPIDEPADGA